MRWVSASLLAVCLSACGGEVYRGVFVPDAGPQVDDDEGEPGIGDLPEVPQVPPQGPRESSYVMVASAHDDFGGVQGENGWRYGYMRPESYLVSGRGNTGPTTDASHWGTPDRTGTTQNAFTEFPHFDDVVPFQAGPEWVRFDDLRWLYVGATGMHPHGPAGAPGVTKRELWPVRRFEPAESGTYLIRVAARLDPALAPCPLSDGVSVELWRNHIPVNLKPLGFNERGLPVEQRFDNELEVDEGMPVDLVVKPGGNDVCDAVQLDLAVFVRVELR